MAWVARVHWVEGCRGLGLRRSGSVEAVTCGRCLRSLALGSARVGRPSRSSAVAVRGRLAQRFPRIAAQLRASGLGPLRTRRPRMAGAS